MLQRKPAGQRDFQNEMKQYGIDPRLVIWIQRNTGQDQMPGQQKKKLFRRKEDRRCASPFLARD